MNNLDFDSITAALLSKNGATQIAILVVAFLTAWLLTRMLRPRLPDKLEPGFAKIGAGSANRLMLPLLFLVFAWLGRLLLAKFLAVPILDIAMPDYVAPLERTPLAKSQACSSRSTQRRMRFAIKVIQ